MKEFIPGLASDADKPRKVPGSGNHFETVLWLDGSDRTRSWIHPEQAKKDTASMRLAVNEFGNYFNVRKSNIRLNAGEEVSLRIKQVQHVATENFKSLSLKARKCRFPHEIQGNVT